ncbi:hypothetical protein ACQPXM_09140 [Kribbella sp. CA-253562]|uniref:hypothetical protein n=1 Tax=Kribbella sp. CA-253562 TaxID=3239942 RepID=UPI003D8DC79C
MVTTEAFASHSDRDRWLRRAGAAAVATAVLGLGSTGLAVAVLTARQPDASTDPQAANSSGTTNSTPDGSNSGTTNGSDQQSSGLGQADQDAPAHGGSNGS